MKVKIDSDGSIGYTGDMVMNRNLHDYKWCQGGSQVMMVGWWYIDKIDDNKWKSLDKNSLVIGGWKRRQ